MITLLTIILFAVATAHSQEYVFIEDSVYEASAPDTPGGIVTVHNHSADTLFIDTIIVDILSSPRPGEARLRFTGNLGFDSAEAVINISGNHQQMHVPWPYFPANDIIEFNQFCFEYPYPDSSLCNTYCP